MRRIYFVLALMAISMAGYAQHTLNVVLKSGDYVNYDFSEKPKATVGKATINLTTSKVQVVFNMNEVQRFSIDDTPESLTKVESVVVSSQQEGPLEIYNLEGVLVKRGTQTDSDISYSNLPKGIYIVKKGKMSHKLILK